MLRENALSRVLETVVLGCAGSEMSNEGAMATRGVVKFAGVI